MGSLTVQNLAVSYHGNPVVTDFSLSIGDGELVSLLGPSGAGKTTILKVIAGLLPALAGRVEIDGKRVDHLDADKRDAVLIFQKPLLFPHLDVAGNVGFGLKMKKMSRMGRREKVRQLLELTELAGLEHRRIHQLSGGQQQRVALARGLALEPSIMLLDEPLSNLDTQLRAQIREMICSLQKKTGTTMLFVTHDQSEALMISDRICLLDGGTVKQVGPPDELFYHPADRDTARFFGSENFVPGRIAGAMFESALGRHHTSHPDREHVTAVIRPEHIQILAEPAPDAIAAEVQAVHFEGATIRLQLNCSQGLFTVIATGRDIQAGQRVWLRFPEEKFHFFQQQVY